MSDKPQSSIAVATIKVNGAPLPDKEEGLEEIVVDSTYSMPSMATLRFLDRTFKWLDKGTFKIGAKLEIMLAPPVSLIKTDPAVVFLGEIVAIEPNFTSEGPTTLTVRAYDLSHRLHIGTYVRTFTRTTDSDIIRKICKDCGMQAGSLAGASKVQHEYVLQPNITNYDFLVMLARRSGAIFSVTEGKVNFLALDSEQDGPTLIFGESLRHLSVRMSAGRMTNSVEVRGWNFKDKKELLSTIVPKKMWREIGHSSTGGGTAQVFSQRDGVTRAVTLTPQLQNVADVMAKAIAADQEGQFIEADGVAYGHPGILAGVKVKLEQLSSAFTGTYVVTSATHIFNSAGYEVHFTISGRYPQTFNELLNPNLASASTGKFNHVVVGIVTNVKDTEGFGRVKVKFPWLTNDEESHWARLVMPSAGGGRGILYMPEINDEVLVAFEHGDPHLPYVIGALWNGKDKPPEAHTQIVGGDGKINRRVIYSRTGHKIVLDDTQGAENIEIVDKTGNNLFKIDTKMNAITIQCQGNMTLETKANLAIKVTGNMTVDVTGQIKTTSNGLEMNSNAPIKLDSKATVDIKAAAALRLDGTMMAEMSAANTNVKASTLLNIQGTLVKIN